MTICLLKKRHKRFKKMLDSDTDTTKEKKSEKPVKKPLEWAGHSSTAKCPICKQMLICRWGVGQPEWFCGCGAIPFSPVDH
jgi:hypothetical protein